MNESSEPNKSGVSSKLAFWRQCFVTAGVSLNITGHGCLIGIAAIINPSLRLPESSMHATPSEESWIASVIGFALIVGNIIITPTMDIIGRKRSHLLSILPILIGWFLLLLVNTVTGLILVRFLQGLSMGMFASLGSIIISEMTDPRNRGAFLTFVSLSLSFGVLFTHSIGTVLSWQQTAFVSSFISFASLVMVIYTPESPPWLVSKGRYDECREVFTWLRGQGFQQDEELEKMIKAQSMIRKSSVEGQTLSFATKAKRYFRYFGQTCKRPEFYKPIFIMLHMYTLFQFGGINVLSSYMIDIIKQVVGPDVDAKVVMVALDVERLLSNLLAIYLMQNLKRRTLLFSTGSLCVLSYFGKAAYVYGKQHDILPFDNKWIPIVLIGIYVFSLTAGLSSLPFAISGEIFPLAYRGLGSGISVMSLSFNFFFAVKCFPVLYSAIGLPFTYVMYAGVVTYCLTFIFFMLPETKGKTLQDIEDSFRDKSLDDEKASEPLKDRGFVEYSASLRRSSSQIIC